MSPLAPFALVRVGLTCILQDPPGECCFLHCCSNITSLQLSTHHYPCRSFPASESLSRATIGPFAWCIIIILRHHNHLSVTPLQLSCRIIHNHGLYSFVRQRCIPGHQYTCPLHRTRLQDSSYSRWWYLPICLCCSCSWLLCAQMFSQPAAEADPGETTGIGFAWRFDASLFCLDTSTTIICKPIRLHPGTGQ